MEAIRPSKAKPSNGWQTAWRSGQASGFAFSSPKHPGCDIRKQELMISLQHLTKRFGAQTAVDSLSFEVPAGQIVGFLGPNGAGKSTTLKMLTGMIEPSQGTATICGFDLRREPLEVRRRAGIVPESGAECDSLTG